MLQCGRSVVKVERQIKEPPCESRAQSAYGVTLGKQRRSRQRGRLTPFGTTYRPCLRLAVLTLVTVTAACGSSLPEGLIVKFRAVCAELARNLDTDESIAIRGLDDWLFFGPELRHVSVCAFWGTNASAASRARRPDAMDPLPAILNFKQQLDEAGVELLLVPVPPKSVIYPDKLSADLSIPMPAPRLDTAHQDFYTLLREQGVEVLDLTERFLEDRFHPDGPLYCRLDTHWSGTGCVVAAQEIATVVRQRDWFGELETGRYLSGWYATTITGDLWRNFKATNLPREELRLRGIAGSVGPGSGAITTDPESPIVLLGDSHALVFHAGKDMHAVGAGLVDQIAFELGVPVELFAVRGSGATPARLNLMRRAQGTDNYWEQKRLVIWSFAAREFTESDGWQTVPIGT